MFQCTFRNEAKKIKKIHMTPLHTCDVIPNGYLVGYKARFTIMG
jgi:hypothetical protein